MHIAMWSGPRNLSTAMMYSFGARHDTAVWDEPFYGPFLELSGIDHPMRVEILANVPRDPHAIAARCTGPVPNDRAHFYQKHMCHHMLPGVPRDWMREVTNVFLIRHPARVLASYLKKRERPTLDDIGLRLQLELFEQVAGCTGQSPAVIDSATIRQNPEKALGSLCETIGLSFDPAMLKWPAGGHPEDGPWARHWYPEIWKSTGFAAAEGPIPDLPPEAEIICQQALPIYEQLAKHAIRLD